MFNKTFNEKCWPYYIAGENFSGGYVLRGVGMARYNVNSLAQACHLVRSLNYTHQHRALMQTHTLGFSVRDLPKFTAKNWTPQLGLIINHETGVVRFENFEDEYRGLTFMINHEINPIYTKFD